jgi:hypothetical protein
MVPNDAGVVAVFRSGTVNNPAKSAEAGRPIFDDVELVEVRYPGSRDYGVFYATARSHWDVDQFTGEQRAVTYAERFSKQYQQFKANQQQTKSGTPLDYLTFLTEGKRAELRAQNIYTAEALATIDGAELKNLGPGGREWKNKTIEFLENSSEAARITKLEAELELLKARNEILEEDNKLIAAKEQAAASEFDGMSDAQLREHVRSLTGVAPKGNPSRKTLIRMAQEQKGNVAA